MTPRWLDLSQLDRIDPTATDEDGCLHHCAVCGHELTVVRLGKWQCDNCDEAGAAGAALLEQMSDRDVINSDPMLTGFDAEVVEPSDHPHGHTVGFAFGGDRSDELPEIPLNKAIDEMHKISEWLRESEATR